MYILKRLRSTHNNNNGEDKKSISEIQPPLAIFNMFFITQKVSKQRLTELNNIKHIYDNPFEEEYVRQEGGVISGLNFFLITPIE